MSENSFEHERLSTKPPFEKEEKDNLEMAYLAQSTEEWFAARNDGGGP